MYKRNSFFLLVMGFIILSGSGYLFAEYTQDEVEVNGLPLYCMDETVVKTVNELPLQYNLDCNKECNAYLKCQIGENGNVEPKYINKCVANCNKNGIYNYSKHSSCNEMFQTIDKLTKQTFKTAELDECQIKLKEYKMPDDDCAKSCNKLIEKCPHITKTLVYSRNGNEYNAFLGFCHLNCKQALHRNNNYIVSDIESVDCNNIKKCLKYNKCKTHKDDSNNEDEHNMLIPIGGLYNESIDGDIDG